MAETSSVLVALGATALLLGAGFAFAMPITESLEEAEGSPSEAQALSTPVSQTQDEEGRMTVNHSESTHEGVASTAPPFYASRAVELWGELTLADLPATLANVNGDVKVATSGEDAWSLVANLTGYGATPEDARQARDRMSLEWDVGEPGDHHLVAEVEHEDGEEGLRTSTSRQEARLMLLVPEDVSLGLSVSSTNGDVTVKDLQAASMEISSTNGALELDATAKDVHAETTNAPIHAELEDTRSVTLGSTNGRIAASLAPAESGSIEASTTNADVDLHVPETDHHGYHATASTTNGEATIDLADGDSQRSDDGSQASFQTDGLEQRAIQTTIQASSTNGDLYVGPS